MVAAWFPGTDHGVFLHAGRSGGLIFDVDTPEKLAQPIRQAINQYAPPYQSTRPDKPGRGHYIFATPDGRQLGNSLGDLANGWGEIRGLNGVIIAAPSAHGGGGEYRWLTTGPVPQLPGYVASRLPDALDATDAATDADVAAFLAEHAEPTQPRPDLLDIHALAFKKAVANGESRHATMPGHITGAMKEAAAGLLDAKLAAGTLEAVFLKAVAQQPTSTKQGKPRTGAPARNEWRGLLAWAVGQARAADPAETIQRVEEKFQGRSVENLHELGPADVPPINQGRRRVVLTSAADIKPRRVRWLWADRLALGTLALFAGREGIGKSTVAYDRAAKITNGELPGEFQGRPKAVRVAATEDSWEHIIVPRLIAHGADRPKVFQVEVLEDHTGLVLPKDVKAVQDAAAEKDAVLLILDPIMSRIDDRLDTHKDAEVRRALEPLAGMAHTAGLCVWGIIHHNKGGSGDPLNAVMGSRAFTGEQQEQKPLRAREIAPGCCGKCGDPWTWEGLTKLCRPRHQAAQVAKEDLPAIATHSLFDGAEWWQEPLA